MPRHRRQWQPQLFYHVVMRGNNRQNIFNDTLDYREFFRAAYAFLDTAQIPTYFKLPTQQTTEYLWSLYRTRRPKNGASYRNYYDNLNSLHFKHLFWQVFFPCTN